MDLEKFARQLRLMELLTQNRTLSVEEVGEQMNMNKRTIYRYLDAFKEMGFSVIKEGTKYRLDYTSPFFQRITNQITFTEDEGITLCQILNSVYNHSARVRHLREKFATLYDPKVLAKHGVDNHLAHHISTLFTAIREERVVVLKNYTSPSSGKRGDRIVEPYLFLNENTEVRCFELSSQMNKTFKISRAEDVELLDLLWAHKAEHAPFYCDLFHFTGKERKHVRLIMGNLATSLLLEEFPDATRSLTALPDGRHQLDTLVCSYIGIGRFVLGLLDDIEIAESPEFTCYMKERIDRLAQKCRDL